MATMSATAWAAPRNQLRSLSEEHRLPAVESVSIILCHGAEAGRVGSRLRLDVDRGEERGQLVVEGGDETASDATRGVFNAPVQYDAPAEAFNSERLPEVGFE